MGERFSFSADDAFKEIKKLSTRKATHIYDFPVKILEILRFCIFFTFCVNEIKCPNIFKPANVTPDFKKGY